MSEATSLSFAPLIDPVWIYVLAGLGLLAAGFALTRGLKGWLWRALAVALLAGALANPALVRELREPLSDIALLVTDTSPSMQVGDRSGSAERMAASLRAAAETDPSFEIIEIDGGGDIDGTRLNPLLQEGLSRIPRERLAGVVVVSDGQIHDSPAATEDFAIEAPVHHIVTGDTGRGDRRLIISEAPAYGLVGDDVTFTLRVEDETAVAGSAIIEISIDGGEPLRARVEIGRDVEVRAELANRGPNTVQIEVEPGEQELSLVNNRAAVNVTGVRDRLRVLLVTGEPHNGARAWRNLLKSDPSVDLVHFTILRPLDKDDSVPPDELALIAFPTFELFQLRLEEFDLVIFDRYRRRGILRPLYLDNIATYVRNGGALLVTTGPPYAGPESLARSSLASVLPASPTGAIEEGEFTPQISEAGQRHPVTAPMASAQDSWGPWYRRIGAVSLGGETILESPEGDPLLTLARAGEGRAAILLSDQAWLWERGHAGGGPHDELFRRVAHWLMGEPELDEERLTSSVSNGELRVTRTTLQDSVAPLEIEWPSGRTETLGMTEESPGRFVAATPSLEQGLVRLRNGQLTGVVAAGPLNPREYEDLRPNPERYADLSEASGGTALSLPDGAALPNIRRVSATARAFGTDWFGLRRNNAYVVTDARRTPLAPGLLILALALGLLAGAWRREGA